MDIEVYLKNSGPDEGGQGDTLELLDTFEYGPYVWAHGAVITLEDFITTINDANVTRADAEGIPIFYIWATPFLTSRSPSSSGAGYVRPRGPNLSRAWGGLPTLQRKLSSPGQPYMAAEGHAAMPQDMDITAGANGMYNGQLVIRYDISMVDSVFWNGIWTSVDYVGPDGAVNPFSDGYSYYGFKIIWRTGNETLVSPSTSVTTTTYSPAGTYADVNYTKIPNPLAIKAPYQGFDAWMLGPDSDNDGIPDIDIKVNGVIITSVHDDSPLPPNSAIVPYMGISNKLLIMLNSNTGEYEARPVPILEEDWGKIQGIYGGGSPPRNYTIDEIKALLADPEADPTDYAVEYKKDDPTTKFEIFRMTEKPTSYLDFDTGTNPHATIEEQPSFGKRSDGASLLDDIQPNKKYYYCFRSIDVHHNISNPSHVFEVEMVDNDGQVYIILNTIDFDPGPKRVSIKSGRRFIYIEPSLQNLTFADTDLLEDPIVPGVALSSIVPTEVPSDDLLGALLPAEEAAILAAGGTLPQRVWNDTYKIRITSKKTSRKIDLNLIFKNKGVKNPSG